VEPVHELRQGPRLAGHPVEAGLRVLRPTA
jgi:hypothetical protein